MRFLSLLRNAAAAAPFVVIISGSASGQEAKWPAATETAAPAAPHPPSATPAVAVEADNASKPAPDTQPPSGQPAAPAKKPAAKKPPSPPARDLFGAVKEPAILPPQAIGFYAKGCLAGGVALPPNGDAWQVMRLSRNRFWGHPTLVHFIERFAEDLREKDGWSGLLVGDMSMPRGGPMQYGHASHQVGLDVDLWYERMPNRVLSAEERETVPLVSFIKDPAQIDPEKWTPDYEKLMRRVASYPEVARVFVNPVIKKWLCDTVKGDRGFLHKIEAIPGHHDHFHVRLVCPAAGSPTCQNQPPLPMSDGCGKHLDQWVAQLAKASAAPKPAPTPTQGKSGKLAPSGSTSGLTMAQLPPACQAVLNAPPHLPGQPTPTQSAGPSPAVGAAH